MKQTGKVKFFNTDKGYGFIQPDGGGRDVFVHISAVEATGMEYLKENQKLEYEVKEEMGKMSATNLVLIS